MLFLFWFDKLQQRRNHLSIRHWDFTPLLYSMSLLIFYLFINFIHLNNYRGLKQKVRLTSSNMAVYGKSCTADCIEETENPRTACCQTDYCNAAIKVRWSCKIIGMLHLTILIYLYYWSYCLSDFNIKLSYTGNNFIYLMTSISYLNDEHYEALITFAERSTSITFLRFLMNVIERLWHENIHECWTLLKSQKRKSWIFVLVFLVFIKRC